VHLVPSVPSPSPEPLRKQQAKPVVVILIGKEAVFDTTFLRT
jgi:hypothetical protein